MGKIKTYIRNLKYLTIKMLRTNDGSHKIALGFSVGAVVNFVPSFGFGVLLSVAFAKLVRGNVVAGLLGGTSFIWFFPVLFYLNMKMGEIIYPLQLKELEEGEVEEVIVEVGLEITRTFTAGMGLNIVSFGLIIYIISLYIIKKYRNKMVKKLKSWNIKK